MTGLKDRTALVTGSTSGIGKATAVALAARGARVLVVGRNEQRARDVVAEIEGGGGSATFRADSRSANVVSLNVALPPLPSISATTSLARCSSRPTTSTWAPRAAKAMAVALPIPLVTR